MQQQDWEPIATAAARRGVCVMTIKRWARRGLFEPGTLRKINGRHYLRVDAEPKVNTGGPRVRGRPLKIPAPQAAT